MAFYSFLMQLHNDTQLSVADMGRLTLISEIGGAMSMVCCVLILSLLCLLPVRSDGMFITSNMCVVLMAAQLSFIGAENTGYPNPTSAKSLHGHPDFIPFACILEAPLTGWFSVVRQIPNKIMCKIATCVLHYFFLCVHFSSLAYAIHFWSKFAPMCLETCRRRGVYIFTIWLVPGIIVIMTAVARGDQYALEKRCWLPPEQNTRLAFLLPVFLIQLANWILYVMIIRTGIVLDRTKGKDTRTILRHMLLSSLSMFPVFGLQWTLGFAVTFDLAAALQYTFVILASGQGLLLLIFHVLTNGQVQRALCTKISEKVSDTSSPSRTAQNTVDSNLHSSHASKT